MSSSQPSSSLRLIILGNDALLQGRPASPVQMAQACLRAGFDFVAPVSWGEELIAERMIDAVASGVPVSIACHCPIVARSLGRAKLGDAARGRAAAPPIATTRYARRAFAPRKVHITFVGRCPSGSSAEIDKWIAPDVFWNGLVEVGIEPTRQSVYFESILPPDRRRFASVPGGLPDERYLFSRAGTYVREVALETLAVVASTATPEVPLLLDPSAAFGCSCSRHRRDVEAMEPLRAHAPVVASDLAPDAATDPDPGVVDRVASPSIRVNGARRYERPVLVSFLVDWAASEPETLVESATEGRSDVRGSSARLRWALSEAEAAGLLARRVERADGNGAPANGEASTRVPDDRSVVRRDG